MAGNVYFYRKDHTKNCNGKGCKPGCEHEELEVAIRNAIKHFVDKFGYYPEFAIVRLDEYVKGKYPIRVIKVIKSCQPSHFMLCPVVGRKARVFKGERKTYHGSR